MKTLVKALIPAALLLLAACGQDKGPVEIKYDRDACENCGMIISNPRYAAELRLAADNSTHKFDDIGDAMNWLERQGGGLAGAREIWVMDSETGQSWLDARTAFYRHGESPMNYDFAAIRGPAPDAVDFAAMRSQALAHASSMSHGMPPAMSHGMSHDEKGGAGQ